MGKASTYHGAARAAVIGVAEEVLAVAADAAALRPGQTSYVPLLAPVSLHHTAVPKGELTGRHRRRHCGRRGCRRRRGRRDAPARAGADVGRNAGAGRGIRGHDAGDGSDLAPSEAGLGGGITRVLGDSHSHGPGTEQRVSPGESTKQQRKVNTQVGWGLTSGPESPSPS